MLTTDVPGLKDSKKLSKLQRAKLTLAIQASGASIGIGWVSPEEVDQLGLTRAVQLAMERALQKVALPYDEVIIDGNHNFLEHLPRTKAIVRADDSVPAVSAASIVAKVARDTFMAELALEHPGYGFEKHVGYGTAAHLAALQQLGVTKVHRKSYKPVRALIQ
jgi:ribonuclease HII